MVKNPHKRKVNCYYGLEKLPYTKKLSWISEKCYKKPHVIKKSRSLSKKFSHYLQYPALPQMRHDQKITSIIRLTSSVSFFYVRH